MTYNNDIPCCAQDAIRRIRQIEINGISTGISMADKIFEEVFSMKYSDEKQIKDEIIKKVRIYNYVPRNAEKIYADAIYEDYNKEMMKK